MWEFKFNELYSEFVKKGKNEGDGHLQKENMELRERVRELERR